jgi:hypothetical protein
LRDDHGAEGIDVRRIGIRARAVKHKLRALATFAAVSATLVASGCGGGGGGTSATTGATTPPATSSTPTGTASTATAPTATAPPPTATSGGGGGSEPIRVPATFTLRAGRLSPRVITVPPFLAVAVSVRNLDSRARVVTIHADRAYRLAMGPGGRAARTIRGQRAGTYPVTVSGGGRGTLVVGGEPGP